MAVINFAAAHYFLALASTYAGYCDHVFEHADKVERLEQRDLLARAYAGAHENIRATASFAIERYREGVNFARRAAAYIPNSPPAHRALTINLALAGKLDEARQEVQTLRRFAPTFSQSWIKQNYAVWGSSCEAIYGSVSLSGPAVAEKFTVRLPAPSASCASREDS